MSRMLQSWMTDCKTMVLEQYIVRKENADA